MDPMSILLISLNDGMIVWDKRLANENVNCSFYTCKKSNVTKDIIYTWNEISSTYTIRLLSTYLQLYIYIYFLFTPWIYIATHSSVVVIWGCHWRLPCPRVCRLQCVSPVWEWCPSSRRWQSVDSRYLVWRGPVSTRGQRPPTGHSVLTAGRGGGADLAHLHLHYVSHQ